MIRNDSNLRGVKTTNEIWDYSIEKDPAYKVDIEALKTGLTLLGEVWGDVNPSRDSKNQLTNFPEGLDGMKPMEIQVWLALKRFASEFLSERETVRESLRDLSTCEWIERNFAEVDNLIRSCTINSGTENTVYSTVTAYIQKNWRENKEQLTRDLLRFIESAIKAGNFRLADQLLGQTFGGQGSPFILSEFNRDELFKDPLKNDFALIGA